jgi:alkylation response protein AidB-like acyl-CoA dehydrogenase
VESWTFAQARRAFGSPIGRYPLVMEALAEMKAELYAMVASTMRLSALIQRMDLGLASEEERAVHRLLVNINKYETSVQASLGIRRAQEILGGNGAIEDFSIVPRLYRDAVVFESWEGSHNVLCLQVTRDMQRYGLQRQLFDYLGQLVDRVAEPSLAGLQDEIVAGMELARERVERVVGGEPLFHQAHARRVVDELAVLVQAACLLVEAEWELSQGLDTDKREALELFLRRHGWGERDAMADGGHMARLERLAERL